VDYKCDYLIFEAYEAPSFMQRFGRVGQTVYVIFSHILFEICSFLVVGGDEQLAACGAILYGEGGFI